MFRGDGIEIEGEGNSAMFGEGGWQGVWGEFFFGGDGNDIGKGPGE